jgi:hypothetical protein
MRKLQLFLLFFLVQGFVLQLFGQQDSQDWFAENGEIYFRLEYYSNIDLEKLSSIISIDHRSHDQWIYAYANERQFKRFLNMNIPYEQLPKPGDNIVPNMKTSIDLIGIESWDFYPTYEAYIDMMYQFETDYPDLVDVFSIGTSMEGRQLMMAKISNNVQDEEGEPRALYTATMHGDELAGYPLMLRLIDYLLTQYGSNDQVNNLVNNLEIWINPLANPDGTYAGGNNTVVAATRGNANYIDINRNFPDPEDGDHPDGNEWQKETIEFMELADSVSFVLAANFHSGAEVFNYPWDTWSKLPADDEWWQYVGHEWADTAQYFAPQGYMTSVHPSGVTNGYAWYSISGGRQDFMNYFHHCREVTLEIANAKFLPANQLPDWWEYNYRSFLNYLEQALFGIHGTITDSISGEPVAAAVFIENHDTDNSWIVSDPSSGKYYRPIFAGTYGITFSANGYQTKSIIGVEVENRQIKTLDVELVYTGSGIGEKRLGDLFVTGPNPVKSKFFIDYKGQKELESNISVINSMGQISRSLSRTFRMNSERFELDLSNLPVDIYVLRISTDRGVYYQKLIIN